MSTNVKLSDSLVEQAKRYALIQHRSVPKQIEYGSQVGKIAEENPDLPFSMIRDILIADQEAPAAGGSPGKAFDKKSTSTWDIYG